MKPAIAVLYSDASAAALIDALKTWRQAYAPSAGYEELLANFVTVVQVKTRILPEGKAIVQVVIEGRRYGTNDGYYFEATLKSGELVLLKCSE